jgi:hypothetical protein
VANLIAALDAALFTALNIAAVNNVATGGVYSRRAPQGTVSPYLIYNLQSKVDDYWAYTKRGGQALYLVKAVSKALWPKEAQDIDTQIDTALQDATLTITGFSQIYCRREANLEFPEEVDGVIYQHVGGIYRIIADES